MKKRIYRSLCAVCALVLILTATLSMWSFYRLMIEQAREDLAQEFDVIQQGIETSQLTDREFLYALDRRFFRTRITLIDRDGDVLYDSTGTQGQMENHAARKEVQDAFAGGTGEDIRRSHTKGESTFYYARRLDSDHVLRIAKPTRVVSQTFEGIVPVMLVILVLIAGLGMWMAARMTRMILRPIERLTANLDRIGLPEYEELQPFFLKIREQNEMISEQMQTLREERDTVRTITSNMQEGLILLDLERRVLSVNRSTFVLLKSSPDTQAKTLLEISRDTRLIESVDRALAGDSNTVLLERGESVCRVCASPVYNDDTRVCGVIVLLVDVTEQQRAEKIRREFSANVSHELKTPLTSISGFAEMISGGMVSEPEELRKFAGRIYHEASRLITLTDDIIRLSRIEAEGELDREPTDLRSLCTQAVEPLLFAAEQKRVTVNITGDRMWAQVNPRMIEELIFNLADNAVKYNQTDGKVEIDLSKQGEWAVIRVRDTGIGIPPEQHARVFERFYRVDKSRSKQSGGTGLGLSIVKHIAERHGGIVAVSSGERGGTVFTVRLPVGEVPTI